MLFVLLLLRRFFAFSYIISLLRRNNMFFLEYHQRIALQAHFLIFLYINNAKINYSMVVNDHSIR